MSSFDNIKMALEYIDDHLDEQISLVSISQKFHFSPYYFHRMFSMIVGKTMAVHIRDRRLLSACKLLSSTKRSVLNIALDSGYNSAQSFARAFRSVYGISPTEYRKQGLQPVGLSVDEMIIKFTNRLRGGAFLNPTIIKRSKITIACTSGDGKNTRAVWEAFERLSGEKPLNNKLSDNCYEVRLYKGKECTVFTGVAVSDEGKGVDRAYNIFNIPPSQYASFDVYVANGYDSENKAMDEWLRTNRSGYSERLLNGCGYCVEFYDERFCGSEDGSIVEIWVPIVKK